MERIVPVFHSLLKNMHQIHKNSCSGVSVVQSTILYEISMVSKPAMQEVAEAVGMDITTFSRQVKTLEKKKLIEKTPFEEDRRINRLSLTVEGKQVVTIINASIYEKLAIALTSMNDFERDTVIRSLHIFNERLIEIEGKQNT